jgi:hypothetical protein
MTGTRPHTLHSQPHLLTPGFPLCSPLPAGYDKYGSHKEGYGKDSYDKYGYDKYGYGKDGE